MSFQLNELRESEVIGFNLKAIHLSNNKNPGNKEIHLHCLVHPGRLSSCLGSIFYRSGAPKNGYVNLPIEKMAGLLLYRIAQGQFFINGNKRTAVYSCFFFLFNNGYGLRIYEDVMNDLVWGFAPDESDPNQTKGKYSEDDAIQYIFDNIFVRN